MANPDKREESREQIAKRLRIAEAAARDRAYKRGLEIQKAAEERRLKRKDDLDE